MTHKALSVVVAILSIFMAMFLMAAKPSDEPPASGYVGVTEAIVFGNQGIFTFNRMCHAEFPGSQFCTTQEVFDTVNPPEQAETFAWIHPTFILFNNAIEHGIDYSGLTGAPISLTCIGWTGSGGPGLTLNPANGRMVDMNCNIERPVACCQR